ncbi:hypothetical protein QYM36_001688 [Artemia franciscana]|uniref:Uncharacterized protein n=1 Tax=Artemia franciscana TaxID=6661 RepID=A0AA88LIT1_ARTSF|nr:hypothetical protein QYM36_001688 [Artemia franciscana]
MAATLNETELSFIELSEEELRRFIEDDNGEDLSSDSDGDPKDKDWVPDKDGSSLDSDGKTPNQESFIEVDISAPDPTFPKATATELDVVDDQASQTADIILRNRKWAFGADGESLQVKWNSIKWLNYSIELPTEIHFRYDYDSDFSVIKVNESRHKMKPNKNSLELVSAYKGPIPLPPAKYKDLMDLSHTLVVPRTFHEYYAALPSSESTRDALDESDVE